MRTPVLKTAAMALALVLIGGAPVLGHGDQGPGGMMGPGMMGPGMMGPGMMGPGMMGPGMMGPGMMGPGMMGPGMMGPGMMGPAYGMGGGGPGYVVCPGMMGQGYGMGQGVTPSPDLSADQVRANLERHLAWLGNSRLKPGDVKEVDENTVTAEIVTQNGSLVDKFAVDRHSGMMRRLAE